MFTIAPTRQQTRRTVLRSALVAVLTTLIGQRRSDAADPAVLTIPLDQWASLRVTLKGRVVTISTAEVFQILNQGVASKE